MSFAYLIWLSSVGFLFFFFSFAVSSYISQLIWISDFILIYSLTILPFHTPWRSKSIFLQTSSGELIFVSLILFWLETTFLRHILLLGFLCYVSKPLILLYVLWNPSLLLYCWVFFILYRWNIYPDFAFSGILGVRVSQLECS